MNMHKSGFVNIIGKPNAGKSTLLNALLGTELSITNRKAQTTRRRILGIWNDENHQIVYSDTPGIIDTPVYKMQEKMNSYIQQTFEDADLILYIADISDPSPWVENFAETLNNAAVHKILVINKSDIKKDISSEQLLDTWQFPINWNDVIMVSALHHNNLTQLHDMILSALPLGPEYYPKDQLSDQSERFFVAEIIRKYILELYKQEIPYSCEVITDYFTESEKNNQPFAHIGATIYVDRATQKSILIGKGGQKIKELGTHSRLEIEKFLGYPIYLELHVKHQDNWRNDASKLKWFGY